MRAYQRTRAQINAALFIDGPPEVLMLTADAVLDSVKFSPRMPDRPDRCMAMWPDGVMNFVRVGAKGGALLRAYHEGMILRELARLQFSIDQGKAIERANLMAAAPGGSA